MLNVPNITKQLESTPLCSGSLIKTVGLSKEYCAVGALAKGVGITDEQLASIGGGDVKTIFNWNPEGFREKYGINSPSVLAEFMSVNDSEPSILRRTKQVEKKVEDIKIDQVTEVINDLIGVSN